MLLYLRRSGRQQFTGVCRLSIRGSGKFWWMTDTTVQVFDPVRQWPGQKPERRHLSSMKTSLIDELRTLALKLLPLGLPQIRWRGTEGGSDGLVIHELVQLNESFNCMNWTSSQFWDELVQSFAWWTIAEWTLWLMNWWVNVDPVSHSDSDV